MSDDADVERLLENFQRALDALNKIEDVENLICKLDVKNRRKELKRVKSAVSEVHGKVNSIKDKVSKAYKRVKVRDNSDKDPDLTESGGSVQYSISEVENTKTTQKGDTSDEGNNSSEEIIESTPQKAPILKLSLNRTKSNASLDVINSSQENLDENSEKSEGNGENQVVDEEIGPPEAENKDNVENGDEGENDAKAGSNYSRENGAPEQKKTTPKIKLVDINKLLAPNSKPMEMTPTPTKNRKSVTFDSSVIVLTSSDEDTPKKDPKQDQSPAQLKSALRKSSSKAINLSDSDSKENNENLRNSRKSRAKRNQSSDDSDGEDDSRSRRLRRHDQAVKDRFSKLVQERNERRRARFERKYFSDDSPNEEPSQRSKRNREKESNDSANEHMKTNTKRRKKKDVLEENLDNAQNPHKTALNHPEPDLNDPKFKLSVYVLLPKFNTEDLRDAYKNKKEIFEVKRLCSRSSSKEDITVDTPENTQIKLTLCLKKNDKEKEDKNSDDERSSPEPNCDTFDLTERDAPDNANDMVQVRESPEEEPRLNGKISDSDEETPSKERDENLSGDSDNDFAKFSKKPNKSKNESVREAKEPMRKVLLTESDSDGEDAKKNKHSSDGSDDDFAHFSKKRDKSKGDLVREAMKRTKKVLLSDSDSDDGAPEKNKRNKDSSDEHFKSAGSSSESGKDEEKINEDEKQKNKPSRRRIKRVNDSSSDDEDKSTRKQIRRMIDRDSLSETTKKAEEEEKDRKARIAGKQKKYNQIFELKADATVDKIVLDFDEKSNKPLLSVSKSLVKQLKPHQVHGVKFMWDACFESLDRTKKNEGSGCILAHCMGLGKTLQVIALSHTLLMHKEKTKVEKILVVCPVNTVLNWKSEFKKWLPDDDDFEVYELVSCKTSSVNQERNYIVKCWDEGGGVLIIGYSMFRTLSNPDNKAISKKLRQSFQTGLVDPGPDLVICDEGHLLKNEKTNLSIAMNRLKTARRIVLTGTPLQNNLREYWCMVQFIKPNLLGTYKEYLNRFVNPITNGQYTDSTQHDIMIMRRRSHVLHKLLDGVVQRQDYAVLEPYLPPKYEYVLFLKLTETQVKLYKHYMDNFARKGDGSNRTSFLFTDFQHLQRICTHPRVLLDKSVEDKVKKDKEDESESEGSLKDFIDDGESDSNTASSSEDGNSSDCSDASIRSDDKKKKKKKQKKEKAAPSKRARVTRAQAAQKRDNDISSGSDEEEVTEREWWDQYITRGELDNINHSAKIFLLFEILKECEEIGDKILVFSQSLYSLNCIEYFLGKIDEATQRGETDKVGGHVGSWTLGLDYFRLDGSSSCDNRASWCDHFNDPENTRARLFLISTKAGGLGINLVAANRVIIFDVSWNPSHDIQSIYRVYRFGQTKPSYIYRFVTYGAMEMKIYERQVTKQAISKRVIDEQQIDRHYSQNDIQELYKTDFDVSERPIPLVPKDVLLGEMLQKYDKTLYKYHEHQSLLENKQDEELNEEERKAAWDEFESEKVIRKTTVTNFGANFHLGAINTSALNFSPQLIQMALGNIVRKDNPTWSDVQIKGILPALVSQLQMQMSENDFSMYGRVQQEIRVMQALHAQRMRENYFKQFQLQQMLQKQHLANQLLGNMNITPEEIRRLQIAHASQNYMQPAQGSGAPGRSSDVIELND